MDGQIASDYMDIITQVKPNRKTETSDFIEECYEQILQHGFQIMFDPWSHNKCLDLLDPRFAQWIFRN